jgi:hypothetical protein
MLANLVGRTVNQVTSAPTVRCGGVCIRRETGVRVGVYGRFNPLEDVFTFNILLKKVTSVQLL